MPGIAELIMTNVDCADPAPMTRFWARVLGWEVKHDEEQYGMIAGPGGAAIGFGRVEDYRPPLWRQPEDSSSTSSDDDGAATAKQFHLDLYVDDPADAERRCVELGATVPSFQPGETWRVLLDPAGHPFCLCRRPA